MPTETSVRRWFLVLDRESGQVLDPMVVRMTDPWAGVLDDEGDLRWCLIEDGGVALMDGLGNWAQPMDQSQYLVHLLPGGLSVQIVDVESDEGRGVV